MGFWLAICLIVATVMGILGYGKLGFSYSFMAQLLSIIFAVISLLLTAAILTRSNRS